MLFRLWDHRFSANFVGRLSGEDKIVDSYTNYIKDFVDKLIYFFNSEDSIEYMLLDNLEKKYITLRLKKNNYEKRLDLLDFKLQVLDDQSVYWLGKLESAERMLNLYNGPKKKTMRTKFEKKIISYNKKL